CTATGSCSCVSTLAGGMWNGTHCDVCANGYTTVPGGVMCGTPTSAVSRTGCSSIPTVYILGAYFTSSTGRNFRVEFSGEVGIYLLNATNESSSTHGSYSRVIPNATAGVV